MQLDRCSALEWKTQLIDGFHIVNPVLTIFISKWTAFIFLFYQLDVLENQRFAVACWQFTDALRHPRNSRSELPVLIRRLSFSNCSFLPL